MVPIFSGVVPRRTPPNRRDLGHQVHAFDLSGRYGGRGPGKGREAVPLGRFPISQRMVIELLGPLVGARGKIQFHHLGPLEDLMYHLWMFCVDIRQWVRRVRAALFLLENGFNTHPRQIAPTVADTMSRLGPVQMEVFGLGKDAWESAQATEPDRRFRSLLELYSCLYERFYPLMAAPFVAANALLQATADPGSLIAEDGRVHHAVVEDLEARRGYPRGLLTGGLNRHLRNSISHGRYDVLSRDAIRMEDRNPHTGQVTWGPHVFEYHELRERVFELQVTSESLLAALIMFDVNNHQVIRERGYVEPRRRRMRLDIAQAIFAQFAEIHGFRCEGVAETDLETLTMRVAVFGEREDQPGEIIVGGHGWARRYVEQVRTEESPIRRQAYGLLQMTLDVHESYKLVVLEVSREDGSPAGRILADREARQHIFEGKLSIEEIRALLAEDTLPDGTMPVIIRGIPRPA